MDATPTHHSKEPIVAKLSQAIQDKAIRYVAEGRIRPENVGGPIESYLAHSDSSDAIYRAIVGPSWTQCDCPAQADCCHRVGAGLLSRLRKVDPIQYNHVAARIRDRAAREDNPITADDLLVA
jgi:hypothetical protein